jgi:hypothetical protein
MYSIIQAANSPIECLCYSERLLGVKSLLLTEVYAVEPCSMGQNANAREPAA